MLSASADMPEHFICPISLQVMRGPVYCIHGESAAACNITLPNIPVYDFDSIYKWLKKGEDSVRSECTTNAPCQIEAASLNIAKQIS